MIRDMEQFDQEHSDALRKIWFLGDVHAQFNHIAAALLAATEQPSWVVFLGDVDIDHKPFQEIMAPVSRCNPALKVAFIHGNHDADTHDHWEMLHDCGEAIALHGRVVDLDGVKVAGIGGNFMGKIWMPPQEPVIQNRQTAMTNGDFDYPHLGREHRKSSTLHGAIYPDDVQKLAKQRADILVTHEAPSCHPHGFAALDDLARSLQVVRTFHGHHHDDLSEEYATKRESLGFDARGVNYCAIKNGLGEHILRGDVGW
jgi:predicted phosphodiesterase